MPIFLILSFFFCLSFSYAQVNEDIHFIQVENTAASPFSIPLYISSRGEISILQNGSDSFSMSPLGQFAYLKTKVNYIEPITTNSFDFLEQLDAQNWIEVRRSRLEGGVGLLAIISKKVLNVGLIPYKGAMQITVRKKDQRKKRLSVITLPKKLIEMESWSLNDYGSFETYGGVEVYINVGVGPVDLSTASVSIQNQFIVTIKKISETLVNVQIGEENFSKRSLDVGQLVATGTFSKYKGKLLHSDFTFDLGNEEHHRLYELVIKGKLTQVQRKLPRKSQSIKWKGNENIYYTGIPWAIGRTKYVDHFEVDVDKKKRELDLRQTKNNGFLTPYRMHNRVIWNNENLITLFWNNEMKWTHGKALENHFLSLGRLLGIRGFMGAIPLKTKLGSTITQIALALTRQEVALISEIHLREIENDLKARCETEGLPCRKERKLKKTMNELKELIHRPWEKMRRDLGLLLGRQPGLIHAIVKTLNLKKDVYFKFLSEKYQSIQGVGEVVP